MNDQVIKLLIELDAVTPFLTEDENEELKKYGYIVDA